MRPSWFGGLDFQARFSGGMARRAGVRGDVMPEREFTVVPKFDAPHGMVCRAWTDPAVGEMVRVGGDEHAAAAVGQG